MAFRLACRRIQGAELNRMSANSFTPSARLSAALAVNAVKAGEAQLETALEQSPGFDSLSGADRAFARLISATVMRRMGQIDKVLNEFLDRPPRGVALAILQTGVAQLLFLNTPAHAAVAESVAIARQNKKSNGYAGLINAVLRRVDREGKSVLARTAPQDNIPNWIRRSWEKAYGRSETPNSTRERRASSPVEQPQPSNTEMLTKRH